MPHMEHFMKGVKEFLPNFLGGQDKDGSDKRQVQDEAHAVENEDMNGGRHGNALGKRPRAAEELQSQPNKKSRRPSEDEYKLTGKGGGRLPTNAVPIAVPTSYSSMDDQAFLTAKRANSLAKPSKPGSGNTFKLQNTLSNGQPGKTGAIKRTNMPFKLPSKVDAGSKPTKSTPRQARDDNNQSFIGDAFAASSPAAKPKRRKTQKEIVPVEVSDDDSVNIILSGNVREVNGRTVSSDSQRSVVELDSQSQPSNNYFQPNEQRHVNQYTNPRPGRSKRRRSSERDSGSVLSRAPNLSSDAARPTSGNTHQSGSIEDLARPSLPFSSPANGKSEGRNSSKPLVPVINLEPKLGDADMERIKKQHEVDKLNDGMSRIFQKSAASTSPSGNQKASKRLIHRDSRSQHQPSDPIQGHPDGSSLRNRFKHGPESAPQSQQPSRRRSMKVASSNDKPGLIQESPDPLSANNSAPLRALNEAMSSPTASRASPRHHSPSDLKPTQFTSSKSTNTRAVGTAQTSGQADGRIASDEDRIPLNVIYSRGCVLDARKQKDGNRQIDLVWNEVKEHLEVHQNRRPYNIYGVDEIMTIGARDVASWHSCKDDTKVVIKGPASETRSVGIIVLEFQDVDGKSRCANLLICATRDAIKFSRIELEKMVNTFNNQSMIVQQDAAKCRERLKAQQTRALQSGAGLERRREKIALEQEEAIRYEQPSDDDKPQVSAHSRMQDRSSGILKQPTTSVYFQEADQRATRKSTRQSKPVVARSPTPPPPPERWTEKNVLDPWHQSVLYPSTGPGRVSVDFQDIERLDEGEFLNDNIVAYALRRIQENMAPKHKSKVHFFNSYFFTSLTARSSRKAINYDAVKKWTKQTDLFDTPYIVVPINENLHWFVAIICNLPNLARKVSTSGNDDADGIETPLASQATSARLSPIRDPEEIPDSQEPKPVTKPGTKPAEQAMQGLTLSDHEQGPGPGSETFEFGEDDKIASSALEPHPESSTQATGRQTGKKSKKRAAPSLRKYPTDQPTIITLDSFGVGHPGQVSTLKKYVEAEAKDKRGMDVSGGDIQGMTAAGIPVQSNYCDCGLYLVGYVEEFAKDPEGFVNKVLSRQLHQDSDFASFDPSTKRAEIRTDLLQMHDEQEKARLALKKAKKEEKEKVAATAVNSRQSSAPPAPSQRSPNKVLSPAKVASPKASSEKQNDASDDGELELAVPKPFAKGESGHGTRATLKLPDQEMSLAGSDTHSGDEGHGEMLDGTVGSEEKAVHEYAPRPTRHKVTSPELDTLGQIFNHGPPSTNTSRPLGEAPTAEEPL